MLFINKLKNISVFFLGIFMVSNCFANNYNPAGVSIEQAVEEAINKHNDIKWVTIEDIEKTLPQRPINVGFSLDDTLFFSSACYYGARKETVQEKRLQKANSEEIDNVIMNDPSYWDKVALYTTKYAIPKQSVINLIKMHQQRGDNIFFITFRKAPSLKTSIDELNSSLKETIAIAGGSGGMIFPVQYSNNASKTALMKKNKLAIFYGNQDRDIQDAQAAKVRPIRIMTSTASINLPHPANGQFGEEVLIKSYN